MERDREEENYSETQSTLSETEINPIDGEDTDWYNHDYSYDDDDKPMQNNYNDAAFCFETDHAALKGNNDYHNLMKTLAVLQAQRIKTVEDIERLEKLRQKVKTNPREYVTKLLRGDTSDIPSRTEVQKVPIIDWSKYNRTDCEEEYSNNKTNRIHVSTVETSYLPELVDNSKITTYNHNSMTVRGRMFDQSKPQTFNQLWTAEEQLRLEELLLEYPPERNENNRWRKIAQALGNRTTTQVCSRVQKYFKKLTKAGLPIPGHHVKTNNMTSIKKNPRRTKRLNVRDSTFFPTQHLGAHQHLDACDEDEIKTRTPALTAELKADIVKKVIEIKRKDGNLSPFYHNGISCDVCAENPLKGTRWHCLVCQNKNLCSDCVVSQLNTGTEQPMHPPSHPLEPLGNPSLAYCDPDYMPDSFQSSNYLDPNFVTPNVL